MTIKREFYSIKEAAQALGKTPGWIYQLINSKRLAFVKVGSFYMVTAAELRKYRKNHKP